MDWVDFIPYIVLVTYMIVGQYYLYRRKQNALRKLENAFNKPADSSLDYSTVSFYKVLQEVD